jgi:heterodisulfide reductase subunit B
MIKLTVKQLVDAATSRVTDPYQTGSVLSRFFALEKPVAVAWRNRGQIKACTEEMKLYEERRLALCEKYGKKIEKTGNYMFEDPENAKKFAAELEELGKQPVEIPGEPIKLSELGTGSRLSESDASLIEMFLTD